MNCTTSTRQTSTIAQRIGWTDATTAASTPGENVTLILGDPVVVRPAFADLPDYLRDEIAAEWGVLDKEAGQYFDTLRSDARWDLVRVFEGTSPFAALQSYINGADACTLRDLGHLFLARSRALELAT